MSAKYTFKSILRTTILLMARIGLPTTMLHRLVYGAGACGLRLSPGAAVIAESLSVTGPATLGRGSRIYARTVAIGSNVQIGRNVMITAKEVSIGDNTMIDEDCYAAGMQMETSSLRLGKDVWIFPHCVLNTTCGLTIGDGTGIGGYSLIWSHGSWQSYVDNFPVAFAPTHIGKNVWLPWHVIVLPGVTIGDYTTLGAGAVVVKDIPANSLAVGSPAKVIKSGAEVWPPPQNAAERQAKIHDVLEHFSKWVKDGFNWRSLTILAADGRTKGQRVVSSPGQVLIGEGDSQLAIVVGFDDSKPAIAGIPLERTFYIHDKAGGFNDSVNYICLERGEFHVNHSHPLFLDFLRYATCYGILLRDSRSACSNRRL